MIIESDRNKTLLELNDNELIIHRIFKDTHISRDNIKSAYFRDNFLFILSNDNRHYSKNLTSIKFSKLNSLEVLVNDLNKKKLIFSFPNDGFLPIIMLSPIYINNMFNGFYSNILFTILFSLFILGIILFLIIRANRKVWVYNIKDREFQKFDKNNLIIERVKFDSKLITKKHCANNYLLLKSEKNRFTLATDIKSPLSSKQAVDEIDGAYR